MTDIDLSSAATAAAWQGHRERVAAARELYMTMVWELQQQTEAKITRARDEYDAGERRAWLQYHMVCNSSLAAYHDVVALGNPPSWASSSTPTGPLPTRGQYNPLDLEDLEDHQDHDTERID